MYISEPTWGAGRTKESVFIYDYKRPLFLIPFNIGLLQHYPYEIPYKINRPFSWEQFTKLNRVNINREVSLESNPFQLVKLKNGFYEIQMLKNDEWINEKPFFVLFTCLDKKVPCHHFTYYPHKFRARYKLTVILRKKGAWKVIVQIFDNELSNLIEKWLFVDFPSNGLWEVCMYSKIDEKYMFVRCEKFWN